MRFLKSCIAAAGVLALAGSALAQSVHAMDLSQKGSGTVHFNGHDHAVSSVHVMLAQGGAATIVARISGPDITLGGTWTAEGTTARLIITSLASGTEHPDKVSATGRLVIDKDGDPKTIVINGKNSEDNNKVALNFGTGDKDHRTGKKLDQQELARVSAGKYSDSESWSRNGQNFSLVYTLDLARESGEAIMTVTPQGDRNEPNDKADLQAHGTILDYLHTGQTVQQNGHWWEKNGQIFIHFDHIRYGSTSRAKSERLSGRLKGTTIFIDQWDKSFYGHDAKLSFEKS